VESAEVTVVIPTKDRWPLLSRSLGSVLAQEDVDFEVIVVDDGSADDTVKRLPELSDPRLRVLRHERSMGVASARNLGVAHARAKWVAFLDDDDFWAPRKLRAELDGARSGANFLYTGMVVIDDRDGVVETRPPAPDELRRTLIRHNFLGAPSTVMVCSDLVRRAGGFDEGLSALADWDLWLRLILDERAILVACPEPLVAYVLHAENMHRAHADSIMAEFRYLVAKHRRHGREVGGPALFQWVAGSQRRSGRRRHAARTYLESAARYRSAGDLARGVGVLLGERAMELGRRPTPPPLTRVPAWVSRFWDG
jgi:glycosyltransferase involved in cell wall biosynthesis